MAINRYQAQLTTKTLPDGRTVYNTAKPTYISPSITDVSVVAGEEDRFDIIANNVYGSATSWWKVASVNGNVNGSIYIKPGTPLIIPTQ